MYDTYGDTDILQAVYPTMTKLLAFFASNTNTSSSVFGSRVAFPSAPGLLHRYPPHGFLGDWVSPHGSEESDSVEALLLNNCYLHHLLTLAVNISSVLGHTDDAVRYRTAAARLAEAVTVRFADRKTGVYLDNRQTHSVMPLASGLVPKSLIQKTWAVLEHTLTVTNNSHVDTGLTGTYFLIELLMQTGRNDLIAKIANQTTFPGWGYFIEQGFTTWPEGWGCASPVGGCSKMHGCFNSIGMFFIEGVAGIRIHMSDPGVPITFRAGVDSGNVTMAAGQRHSVFGTVRSSWALDPGGGFEHNISVPANAEARVMIPSNNGSVEGVTEGNRPVRSIGTDGSISLAGVVTVNRVDYVVLHVLSGDFRFRSGWHRGTVFRTNVHKTDDTALDTKLPSLRELAARQGLFIGTCVDAGASLNASTPAGSNYTATASSQFSIVTAEGEMKWAYTEPSEGKFVWAGADQIVAAAQQYNWKVRGHNLAWDIANPKWLYQNFTGDKLRRLLKDHIDRVVGRWRGKIYSWDVINEGISSHPTPHLKKDTASCAGVLPCQTTLWWPASNATMTYLDMAFRWAHAADPNAKLYALH